MEQRKTKLLLTWLNREKKSLYRIYFMAFLQGGLYLCIPLIIQGIITYTMAGRFSASLILLSSLTVIATAFIGVLQLWQLRINESLKERIFCDLTDRLAYYMHAEKKHVGTKISHFFEVITLQKGIGKILLEFSFSFISIILGLLILPAYSSWFVLFSVVLGISFYFIITYYGKKAMNASVETSTKKYQVFSLLREENIGKNTDYEELDDILGDYLKERKIYYRTYEKQYRGILLFKVMFITILLFIGAYLVQSGELNIGQFVASEIIVLLVINAAEKLFLSLDTFYDIITALYKIEQMFPFRPEMSFLNSEEVPQLNASHHVYKHNYSKKTKVIFYSILTCVSIILICPWTQSIELNGQVSVLNPENKPQPITSRIAGRIENWYISDGDFVHKDDTIAFISEIKEEYLDSLLVERSEKQVSAKQTAVMSYESKVNAIDEQINALNKSLKLKTEQVKNKILQAKTKLSSDSADASAARSNYIIWEEQFKRYEDLLSRGVISKTDFESRKVKLQEALAKKVAAENKIIATRNELLNTELELNGITQEYNEKLMKAESEKYGTMSMLYDAEGSLTKLQNQLANYSLRNSYYYVLAPQDGYISNVVIRGVGEIVKEGGIMCTIVPTQKEQSVELYVEPVDLPLLRKGQSVQLRFDGWPAFVFSGWPGVSYGTYTAEIVAFDRVISSNGKFRVLAVNKGEKWPNAIQIGSGVEGFGMLKNVPVIYELWRKANGFPPEFYQTKTNGYNDKKDGHAKNNDK